MMTTASPNAAATVTTTAMSTAATNRALETTGSDSLGDDNTHTRPTKRTRFQRDGTIQSQGESSCEQQLPASPLTNSQPFPSGSRANQSKAFAIPLRISIPTRPLQTPATSPISLKRMTTDVMPNQRKRARDDIEAAVLQLSAMTVSSHIAPPVLAPITRSTSTTTLPPEQPDVESVTHELLALDL